MKDFKGYIVWSNSNYKTLQTLIIANKKYGKKLFYSMLTAFLLIIISFSLDTLPASEFVYFSGERIYSLREFFLVILFRVAPILVPIMLATSSLILNKYNETFFTMLFKNNNIRLLINYLLFYLFFHMLVLFITKDNIGEPDTIRWYTVYLIDTLSVFLFLIILVLTIVEVFTLSIPTKIIENVSKNINEISTYIKKFEEKKVDKENYLEVIKNEIDINKSKLSDSILKFRNITITAIKSKDYNTVNKSLLTIDEYIWKPIIGSLKHEKSKSHELEIARSENGDEKSVLISDFIDHAAIKTQELYKEVFDTAYESKEYFICDQLIENLSSIAEPLTTEVIYKIYLDMYRTVLRVNDNGNTSNYCSKITTAIKNIVSTLPHDSKEIINFVRETVDYGNSKVLKKVLLDLKEILYQFEDERIRHTLYEELYKVCLIALNNKMMNCFEQIIKFIVTKELEIKQITKIFSKDLINSKSKQLRVQEKLPSFFIEGLEDEKLKKENRKPFLEDNRNFYLSLKCYFIFISYYYLQNRISRERIKEEHRDIKIHAELISSVSYSQIRTLFLDLQTFMPYWDQMFVSQSMNYFTYVGALLLEKKEIRELYREVEMFNGPELLKKLAENV